MARAPQDRYPDMAAVAEDLRRYLEGRVVMAHGAGLAVALRKWVARNRAVAAGLVVALCGTLVGGLLWLRVEQRRLTELEELATLAVVDQLEARAAELWPAYPALVPELERWLRDAQTLAARAPGLERELEELRARADDEPASDAPSSHPRAGELEGLRLQLEMVDAGHHPIAAIAGVSGAREDARAEAERARLQVEIAALEATIEHERPRRFDELADQVRHDTLAEPHSAA